MKKLALVVITLLGVLPLPLPAWADTISPLDIGFTRITDNSAQGDEVALNLNVSQVDEATLLLQFSNLSGIESSVSEIYFQDLDGLIARYQILNDQNTGNVRYEEGAKPPGLPGGSTVNFATSFAMEADNPSTKYGINPEETLTFYIDLAEGVTMATLLEGLQSGSVRVGAHVQSIAGGTSDAYVSTTGGGAAAPEPGTMALVGSGLLAGWLVRRRAGKRPRGASA